MIDQNTGNCDYCCDYYPPDKCAEEVYVEEITNNNYTDINSNIMLYVNNSGESYYRRNIKLKTRYYSDQNMASRFIKSALIIILIISTILGFVVVMQP